MDILQLHLLTKKIILQKLDFDSTAELRDSVPITTQALLDRDPTSQITGGDFFMEVDGKNMLMLHLFLMVL